MNLKDTMGKTPIELTVTDIVKIAVVLGVSRIALSTVVSVTLIRLRRKYPELAQEVRDARRM